MAVLAVEDQNKPTCPCCNGQALHEWRAYVSPSPEDLDAECDTCHGSGKSWHHARRNSCRAYRDLMRGRN